MDAGVLFKDTRKKDRGLYRSESAVPCGRCLRPTIESETSCSWPFQNRSLPDHDGLGRLCQSFFGHAAASFHIAFLLDLMR